MTTTRVPSKRDTGPAPAPDECWDSTIHVLTRAQEGDQSAARVLIERALPSLRRWTHGRIPHYGRGPADTEDVVQDAVLQTLRRLEAFEHRHVAGLQAYLRQAVMNRIRDAVRRVRRRGVPLELPDDIEDSVRSPLEAVIMKERLDRFLDALQRLRSADRQIIVWRVELGYSYEEIAQKLGKTAPATRMKVTRAISRLAKEMGVAPLTREPR